LRGHQGFLLGFRFACLPSSYFLESPCHGRASVGTFKSKVSISNEE
jgi:hypothetical protein